MLLQAWLFLGAIAALTTGAALWTAENNIAILTGVLGFISWGLWAYGAFDLTVVRDATVYTYTQPEVAVLGVALAIVPGFIALNGPVEMIARYRDVQADDV
jgi:hypothetical protein